MQGKVMLMIIKTYSELIRLPTFEERFNYLKLGGRVGADTFGFDRYINQAFYKSGDWLAVRDEVIIRDHGCDLGLKGYEIPEGYSILVHHMNPVNVDDIVNVTEYLLNPEYLITTYLPTHNAIHYGDESSLIAQAPVERRPFDTCPWRR